MYFFLGPEECLNKTVESTLMKPEEVCDLQPTTDCQVVTNLIPHLEQKQICEDVPKEFCHTKFDSPKMVKKPIKTKWCTFLDDEEHVKKSDDNNELDQHPPPQFRSAEAPDSPMTEDPMMAVDAELAGLSFHPTRPNNTYTSPDSPKPVAFDPELLI